MPGDGQVCEAFFHNPQGLGVGVHEHAVSVQLPGRSAQSTAAREKIAQAVALAGVDAHDAVDDAPGLLGRVARFFASVGADDGVPPGVGGGLAAGGLLGADQARSQVGDAIDLFVVEAVVPRVLRIPQQVVVLGGPAAPGAGPVVVGPDDLVLEAVASEDNGVVYYRGNEYIARTLATKGYQGYFGLGWRGHIMIPLRVAFQQKKERMFLQSNRSMMEGLM